MNHMDHDESFRSNQFKLRWIGWAAVIIWIIFYWLNVSDSTHKMLGSGLIRTANCCTMAMTMILPKRVEIFDKNRFFWHLFWFHSVLVIVWHLKRRVFVCLCNCCRFSWAYAVLKTIIVSTLDRWNVSFRWVCKLSIRREKSNINLLEKG